MSTLRVAHGARVVAPRICHLTNTSGSWYDNFLEKTPLMK